MKPNNVTRLLESHGISYTVFELPAEKLGALEAAGLMGVPAEQVFKTMAKANPSWRSPPGQWKWTSKR
jgi:prolyl-tRNA editing enzyme YbaK/EbsC (Cys-tRNA(Pro) deacylase)